MTSAFCLFVFETFVSRLLALFGTIITSESGNPTPPGDKWERKLLVFGIFYSFLTSGRPLSSSTALCIIFINFFVQSQRHKAIKETLSPNLQIALTLRLHVTKSGHARFDLLSQSTAQKEVLLPRGDSHIKLTAMLVISLWGVNCRFWSHLGCLGCKVTIFAHSGIA